MATDSLPGLVAGPTHEQSPSIGRSRTRTARTATAILLLLFALVWPFLEIGPRGPLLIDLTTDHGIDARDLFALVPLMIAVVLLWSARRRHRK